MAPPAKPIAVGARFGSLVVLAPLPRRMAHRYYLCACDCGRRTEVRQEHLRASVRSCKPCSKTVHGGSRSPEYGVWCNMRRRCEDPTIRGFSEYGGRGISVCRRWQRFDNFFADMGPRPSARHQIEREDNDGNYAPGNCRWATVGEQARNKRTNRVIEFRGVRRCLSDWAKHSGMGRVTLVSRINRGWGVERALTEQIHREKRNRKCLNP